MVRVFGSSRPVSQEETGATAPRSPAAQRLRRPRWTDARLLVGTALVLTATLTGASLLGQDDGPRHWVATRDLPTGHQLTAADLRAVDGASPEGVYLTGDHPVEGGQVLLHPVRAGEFVPAEGVGSAGALDLRRVSLAVSPGSAAMLAPGTRVDLWATPAPESGRSERPKPRRALAGAEVARVHAPDTRLAGGNQAVPVDFLVPTREVEEVLRTTAGRAELTAVPVAGSPVAGEDS